MSTRGNKRDASCAAVSQPDNKKLKGSSTDLEFKAAQRKIEKLRTKIQDLQISLAKAREPAYLDKDGWDELRHANALGEDDNSSVDQCCLQCGLSVDGDGVCVFETRWGAMIPAYGATYDFFCDYECLALYGRKEQS